MSLAAEVISVAACSTLNYMCHVTIFIGSSPLRTVDAGLCDLQCYTHHLQYQGSDLNTVLLS